MANSDLTQIPGSVYFLHPSDHSNLKLVSTQFDGTGYSEWKRSMLIGLISKNKKCFIDGSLRKPIIDSELKAWERCNTMVIGWLISSLDRSVAKSVMYYNSAHDIWKNLADRFGQTSSSLLYSLQEDLSRTYQESNMSIAEYYTKVKGIWDEIDNVCPLAVCHCSNCSCNLTQQYLKDREDQRLIHFLMKLHDNYQQARGNILRMKELPSAEEAYNILLQEQRHQELSKNSSNTPTDTTMAFAFDKKFSYDKSSNKYRSSHDAGQFVSNKPRPLDTNQSGRNFKRPNNYFCDHCHVSGHSTQRCYKLHGYPNPKPHYSKRTAALALDSDPNSTTDIHKTGLSAEQFQNLLQCLGKNDVHVAKDPLEVTTAANVAGPFNEDSFASW